MNTLTNIIGYLLKNYPYPWDLSNSRLTKLVYLTDWIHAINFEGQQVTEIDWFFNHHGPYVSDIIEEVARNPSVFHVERRDLPIGGFKNQIEIVNNNKDFKLSQNAQKVVDKVIEITKDLPYSEFINMVYASYPIKASEKYNFLDLGKFATEFNQLKHQEA